MEDGESCKQKSESLAMGKGRQGHSFTVWTRQYIRYSNNLETISIDGIDVLGSLNFQGGYGVCEGSE